MLYAHIKGKCTQFFFIKVLCERLAEPCSPIECQGILRS